MKLPAAPDPSDWRDSYLALIDRLPDLAARSRLTLCGLSTCVDVYLRLEDAGPLLDADPDSPAGALAERLWRRARAGVGGEMHVEWPGGPAWLDAHLPGKLGLGGTGAQAAQTLAHLGAPTLAAVADRSARQLEQFHQDVGIAADDGLSRAGLLRGSPTSAKLAHYIVEFCAGTVIRGQALPRSSRVICRFCDDPLEDDRLFDRLSRDLAARAGAAILSGYNELPADLLLPSIQSSAALANDWRAAGLPLVHLELGDFTDMDVAWQVLRGLAGSIESLGLSLSELDKLSPTGGAAASRAVQLADQLGLRRVAVHYDTFAMAVTRDDPALELTALMTGCLLAATRARFGRVAVPRDLAGQAVFQSAPQSPITAVDGWQVATCATPWLRHPAATIGLGDTFLAGTLLVLGGEPPLHPEAFGAGHG